MASRPKGDSDLIALPEDELRRLVFEIIVRDDIEPFVRRMIFLLDSLKAGRTREVSRMARRSAEPSLAALLSAVAGAAKQGRTVAAYHTALLAAAYAYEQSVDHACAFFGYLDGVRRGGGERRAG